MKVEVAPSVKNEPTSFFKPVKVWVYIGWIIGIFPVNFDKHLMHFRFKFLSLTTLFALIRLVAFAAATIGLIILLQTVAVSGTFESVDDFYNEKRSRNESLCYVPWFKWFEVQKEEDFDKQNDYILVKYRNFSRFYLPFSGNTC